MCLKRILFVIPSFEIGGTNTSLINMISNFDTSRFEMSVYAINNQGTQRDFIEQYATVLNEKSNSKDNPQNSIFAFFKHCYRLLKKIGIDLSSLYYKRVARNLDKNGYDCIAAFQEGNATELVSYCKNVKKIAWVRSEYGRYLRTNNKRPEKDIYGRFNHIVNVSETAKMNFISFLPQYENKTVAIYNLLNKERAIQLSKEDCTMPGEESFTLISIGRVDPVKHFSEIPIIASSLKEVGFRFRWMILGGKTESYPYEYDLIQSRIKENQVEDRVFLLGYHPNPYSFLKRSHLLVCLSESETFNHTFAEARILGVPVLSVDYESAPEFIKDNDGGRIVPRARISSAISEIMGNNDYYNLIKKETQSFQYDNQQILDTIYDLMS